LLKDFVERNSNIKDIQFDPRVPPKLLIDPYSKDYEEKRKVAHYFLLVASIDEGNVIGRAENARRLMVYLHQKFKEKLLEIDSPSQFEKAILECKIYDELGPLRFKIPYILASVNKFVLNIAKNDLIKYSQRLDKPRNMVKNIGKFIVRMGGPIQKKAWIYMRWMVRPYPDLRIFNNFSPKDLFIPLTRDILRVAVCLGLIEDVNIPLHWGHVEVVTNFARTIFPNDPVKVDFPFFLIGRWLRGKKLNSQNLERTLTLFDEFYKKTGYSILVTKEKTGYSAECPALPGCITQGESEEEVLKHMEEAIAAYLEAEENL